MNREGLAAAIERIDALDVVEDALDVVEDALDRLAALNGSRALDARAALVEFDGLAATNTLANAALDAARSLGAYAKAARAEIDAARTRARADLNASLES